MTRLPLQERSVKGPLPGVAHYDAMLAEAVEKSSDPSPAGRAALYESIRARLISNLRSARLSTSIESELCTFDEAVNRLEALINEKAEKASTRWSSEPIEFKPATSKTRRYNSLERASLDGASQNRLPNPDEPDPTTSGNWLSDLLERASVDDAPEVTTASKGRLKQPSRSPRSRVAESEDALSKDRRGALKLAPVAGISEGAPKTRTPTERRTQRRKMETPDSSLRHQKPYILRNPEDVAARNGQLTLPTASTGASLEPAQDWIRQRRKLLVAIGGLAAVFVAGAGVAMTFLSIVSASPTGNAAPAPVANVSLPQPQADETSNSMVSQSQPRETSNRSNQRIGGDQSERALQRFIRWDQKAETGQASQ